MSSCPPRLQHRKRELQGFHAGPLKLRTPREGPQLVSAALSKLQVALQFGRCDRDAVFAKNLELFAVRSHFCPEQLDPLVRRLAFHLASLTTGGAAGHGHYSKIVFVPFSNVLVVLP